MLPSCLAVYTKDLIDRPVSTKSSAKCSDVHPTRAWHPVVVRGNILNKAIIILIDIVIKVVIEVIGFIYWRNKDDDREHDNNHVIK